MPEPFTDQLNSASPSRPLAQPRARGDVSHHPAVWEVSA